MKKCFGCKRNTPFFLFNKHDSKYQREADKGVTIECRLCCFKRMKKDNGIMQRIDGKFTFVNINPIKYMLRK
jgi:hypothetical protein